MILLWKMAWRNIWRNKRRSIATASAIIAGFAGLNLLGGYILRVERYLRVNSVYINHAGHLSIYKTGGLDNFYNKPKKFVLTSAELKELQSYLQTQSTVEFTAPFLTGMGLLGNGETSVPFLGLGADPHLEKRIQDHPEVRRWTEELVAADDVGSFKNFDVNMPDAISVTENLGHLIGRKVPFRNLSLQQREVQLAGTDYYGSFNAVNGTLSFKHTTGFALSEDTGLLAPLDLLQRLYGTDGVTYLAVFLKPGESVQSLQSKLQQVIQTKHWDFEVFPFDDDRISLFYVGTMGFLYIMAGFFVFLIAGAVALSIVNSTTIGIVERKKEIGTLRALGFQEEQIGWMFTRESVLLTIVSLGVGTVLTKIIAFFVNLANIRFYPPGIAGDMQFVLTPDSLLCFAIAVPLLMIATGASYFVSFRQVKKPMTELLAGT
jgi:putative ABC transport system permease protein